MSTKKSPFTSRIPVRSKRPTSSSASTPRDWTPRQKLFSSDSPSPTFPLGIFQETPAATTAKAKLNIPSEWEGTLPNVCEELLNNVEVSPSDFNISSLNRDVQLEKPPVFVEPSDISFVDKPISTDDLQAVLRGLITPTTEPSSPREIDSPMPHSSCVFQKQQIDENGQAVGTAKKRNSSTIKIPSKIPLKSPKKVIPDEECHLQKVDSFSRHCLSLTSQSDVIVAEELSVLSIPSMDQSKEEVEGASVAEDDSEDSIFADFPESDMDVALEQTPEERMERDKDTDIIFHAAFPDLTSSKCVSPMQKGPRENGDGYELLYQNKPYLNESNKSGKNFQEAGGMEGAEAEVTYKKTDFGGIPSECQVILPMKSTLIMRSMDDSEVSLTQSTESTPEASLPQVTESLPQKMTSSSSTTFMQRRFIAKFAIHNNSSYLYGYKVHCNSCALFHLAVSPKQGLIQPMNRVSITIKTKKCRRTVITKELMSQARLSIKIFQSYTDDPETLNDFFNELSNQRPDLIRTENIDNLLLLDARDILGSRSILTAAKKSSQALESEQSIHKNSSSLSLIFKNVDEESEGLLKLLMGEKEREAFKEQLYKEYSEEILPKVRSSSWVHSMQMDFLCVNQKLRKYFGIMDRLEKFVHSFLLGFVVFCAYLWIVPFLNTTVVLESEENSGGGGKELDQGSYDELPFYGKLWYLVSRWAASISVF